MIWQNNIKLSDNQIALNGFRLHGYSKIYMQPESKYYS